MTTWEGHTAPAEERAYYRKSEDGRERPSASAYLGLACRIYQGPERKFSKQYLSLWDVPGTVLGAVFR